MLISSSFAQVSSFVVHSTSFRWFGLLVRASVVVLLLLSSDLFLASPTHAQTNTLRFEHISTEQGLSQSTVNAIVQDRQGFLWFGTEGGLNEYDGYQFTVYHHDPDNPGSLSDNFVFALYQDQDGTLWIGTLTGLDRLDRSTGVFAQYGKGASGADALSGVPVSAIDQDPSGTLWVGTTGAGLYALDLISNRTRQYRHRPQDLQSLSDDSVNSIYVDRQGSVWIGTNGGLDRFDSQTGGFAHILPASVGSLIAGDVSVRDICGDGQDGIWIGTQVGLIHWDRTTNQFTVYRHDPNDSGSLSDDSVKSVYEDTQGTLWVGTLRGLSQFDKVQNHFVRYAHDPNDPTSLSSDYVRPIFEDRSGVLWVGTSYGGLNKYARSTQKFTLYTIHPGLANSLSDNNIWSVYDDRSENLWVGTFFSGLNKLNLRTGKVTLYQHEPSNPASLSDDEIRAILQDRNGTLWIGTEHGGLNRLDPPSGTFLHYQHHPNDLTSLSSDNVFAIYEDRLGRLWIGTENGGLDRFDQASGEFVHYRHDANDPMSLSDDNVRAIYQDHLGALWIGTEHGGLEVLDNAGAHFNIYRNDPNNPSSLGNDWVSSIVEDRTGTLWIGTAGGLDRFDRGTQSFTRYTTKNGLPDDMIYGILADANGNLWLSTNKGLSKFNPAAGTFRNYDVSDGLQGNQFNPGAYFKADTGEFFVGGTQGLNAFFPDQVKDNPISPPVVITALKKYDQTIQTNLAASSNVQLSYQDNFISFEFAALDYNAPEKNQYAYQLVGVDKDWVDAGTRRYASYANLPGGAYTFRVKAANNDGVWGQDQALLRIQIAPPFWETWWFKSALALALAATAFSAYRIRIRSMQARRRELETQVAQRTHELATLNAIAGVVSRSLDLNEVMQEALDRTMQVVKMEAGSAMILDEASQELILVAYRGVSSVAPQLGARWSLANALVGKEMDGTRPLIWNVATDYPDGTLKANLVREGVQLVVGVPLMAKEKRIGVLVLNTRTSRVFTSEELSLLAAIGQQVGIAVENARLYAQAEQAAAITERSRLARELHDSVTQLLYSVTLYAEAAAQLLVAGETATASKHLCELRDTAQEALREMRLLIFELHPLELEKMTLVAAIRARLDAVESRGGMQVNLHAEGEERLPRAMQAELYHIVQEGLNNILKHANAKQVGVAVRFADAETYLELKDDGVGFDLVDARQSGGMGLRGMEERVQKIGGTLRIASAPGKGTIITVQVPIGDADNGATK